MSALSWMMIGRWSELRLDTTLQDVYGRIAGEASVMYGELLPWLVTLVSAFSLRMPRSDLLISSANARPLDSSWPLECQLAWWALKSPPTMVL